MFIHNRSETVLEHLAIQLSHASGVPFYRQIVDQVAQFIRSGQLAPDARLPSVRDLAAQLLVSLITVRRSYADLEAAGYIVRRQGQGTFVATTVKAAARRSARAEARIVISEAIARARRLGLTGEELRSFIEEQLTVEKEGEE